MQEKLRSKHYKGWYSIADDRRCVLCEGEHGKLYAMNERPYPQPPLHIRCRCIIRPIEAKRAGTATKKKINGADWWLKNFGHLPDYYLSPREARALGWMPEYGNFAQSAPGKMLAKGIYRNKNGHLPSAPGRIWHEADIDYAGGWRGLHRILYSNDGLIFVTYDHYKTFIEII